MKIYKRTEIWYDYTRCDVNLVQSEFSITPYDKSKSPLNGFYQFNEIEIPDIYSPEDALEIVKLAYKKGKIVDSKVSLADCEMLITIIKK